MISSTRTETIIDDGDTSFTGHLCVPDSGSGPGVLLCHEIFGVNTYIRNVAERLAELGYVVLAPDLFWRNDPDHPIERHDDEGMGEAFERMGGYDFDLSLHDADAALTYLDRLDETTGSVGVLGFCLGGLTALGVAIRSEPDFAVSYYGSGVGDTSERASEVHCPILFHFGADDVFVPAAEVDKVRAAFEGRDDIEIRVHEGANHAFDNELAEVMHHPVRAKEAWGMTTDFLRRSLSVV